MVTKKKLQKYQDGDTVKDKTIKFFEESFQHPDYRQRLYNTIPKASDKYKKEYADDVISQRRANLQSLLFSDKAPENPEHMGAYNIKKHSTTLKDKSDYYSSVHEGTHGMFKGFDGLLTSDIDKIMSIIKQPTPNDDKLTRHSKRPEEVLSMVYELRAALAEAGITKPGQNVTEDEIIELFKFAEGNESLNSSLLNLQNVIPDDEGSVDKLLFLMNNLTSVEKKDDGIAIAINGGPATMKNIQKYQNSGPVPYSWSQGQSPNASTIVPATRSGELREDQKGINKRQEELNKIAKSILDSKGIDDFTEEDVSILSQSTIPDVKNVLRDYRINRANKAQEKPGSYTTAEGFRESTAALGDKLSLQRLPGVGQYIPDLLDVPKGLGDMAAGLGAIPDNLNKDEYGKAVFNLGLPLLTGALGGLGTTTRGQFLNSLVNPLAGISGKTKIKDISELSDSDAFYRVVVGDEAYKDIVDSGVVRTNATTKPRSSVGIDLGNRPTAYPSFSKGNPSLDYAADNPNNYIIVSKDKSIQPSNSGRHGKGTTMFPTDETGKHLSSLDAKNVEVYKHLGNGKYQLVLDRGSVLEYQNGGPTTMKKIKKNKLGKYQNSGPVKDQSFIPSINNIFQQGLGIAPNITNPGGNPFGTSIFGDQLTKGVFDTAQLFKGTQQLNQLETPLGDWGGDVSKGIEKSILDEDMKKYKADNFFNSAKAWADESGQTFSEPSKMFGAYQKSIQDRAGQQYDNTIAAQKTWNEYGKPLAANMAAMEKLTDMQAVEGLKGNKRALYDVTDEMKGMENKGIFQLGGAPQISALQQALGYKDNSPFKNMLSQVINSNRITMDGVSQPLQVTANTGERRILPPNSGLHVFPGATSVLERPVAYAQDGVSTGYSWSANPANGNVVGPPTKSSYATTQSRETQRDIERRHAELTEVVNKILKSKKPGEFSDEDLSVLSMASEFGIKGATGYLVEDNKIKASRAQQQPDEWTRKGIVESTAATGDKMRLFPSADKYSAGRMFDDWVNPLVGAGDMVSSAGASFNADSALGAVAPWALTLLGGAGASAKGLGNNLKFTADYGDTALGGISKKSLSDAFDKVVGLFKSNPKEDVPPELLEAYSLAKKYWSEGLIDKIPETPKGFDKWLEKQYNNKPLYRVVDVNPSVMNDPVIRQNIKSSGLNPDDPVDVAKYMGTTVAPKNILNRGRRSGGHEDLLRGSNKDILYYSDDPTWLGKRYGGDNPYYVKVFKDELPKGLTNQVLRLRSNSQANKNYSRDFPNFNINNVPSGVLFEDGLLRVGNHNITPIIGDLGTRLRNAINVVDGPTFDRLDNKFFQQGGAITSDQTQYNYLSDIEKLEYVKILKDYVTKYGFDSLLESDPEGAAFLQEQLEVLTKGGNGPTVPGGDVTGGEDVTITAKRKKKKDTESTLSIPSIEDRLSNPLELEVNDDLFSDLIEGFKEQKAAAVRDLEYKKRLREALALKQAAEEDKRAGSNIHTGMGRYTGGGNIQNFQNSGQATRQDSIDVYNNAIRVEDYFRRNGYSTVPKRYLDNEREKKLLFDYMAMNRKNMEHTLSGGSNYPGTNRNPDIDTKFTINDYYQKIDKNKFRQREGEDGLLDLRSPMPLYNKNISPQMISGYINENRFDILGGDIVTLYGYDPIAVKPVDMLTPNEMRIRKQRYPNSFGGPKPSVINKIGAIKQKSDSPIVEPKPRPSINISQLDTIQPELFDTPQRQVSMPDVEHTDYESGEMVKPYEGVPNVNVVFKKRKSDGRLVPFAYENSEGQRIGYNETLTRKFQYPGKFQSGGGIPILNLSKNINPMRLNPQGIYKMGGLITEGSEYNKREQPTKNPISGGASTGPMGPKDMPSYDGGIRAIIDQEKNEIIPTENLIPIQTEKGELIVLPTGDVVPVMAKKRHHQMDEDEVTDVAPEGAYILSSFGRVKIKKKEAENVIAETGVKPYKLGIGQETPTEKTLGDIMTKKEMAPAEVGKLISRRFPVIATDNPYEAAANTENKINRRPYLEGLIQLSEFDKMRKGIDTSTPEATREYREEEEMYEYEGGENEMEGTEVEEMMQGGNPMFRRNISHAQDPLTAAAIQAGSGLLQSITSIIGSAQQRKAADQAYRDVLRMSNQSADRQRGQLGLGAAAGILGTLSQDPTVNAAYLNPTYINQMQTRTPSQITDSIANSAFANMPTYSNLAPQQQMLASQAAWGQALKAAGDARMNAWAGDRDAKNKQLQALQGYLDTNENTRVAAQNATRLNRNQQIGNVGDRTQGYFDSTATIEANLGQTQTNARLGQGAAQQQAIRSYTQGINQAIGTAGAAAYDLYANKKTTPTVPNLNVNNPAAAPTNIPSGVVMTQTCGACLGRSKVCLGSDGYNYTVSC